MSDLKIFMNQLADGATLSRQQAREAFGIIMSGSATPAQTGAFLMALRLRGETVDELIAAVEVLREKMLHIKAPAMAIDTCGTGGDAKGTLNISTAAAIVAASAGAIVAKHGNRAVSSKSGSADVLQELGIDLDAELPLVERALREAHITFLMAPRHHAAMRHVASARGELGIRTIFNLVGPLANPAGVTRQILGVFSPHWVEPLAEVLLALGTKKAWVVHGAGGLDELSLAGVNKVAEIARGKITCFEIRPEDAGLPKTPNGALRGGTPKTNARKLRALLEGKFGPYRDVVLMNAGAALMIAGKAGDLKGGVKLAASAIDRGRARATLNKWLAITQARG